MLASAQAPRSGERRDIGDGEIVDAGPSACFGRDNRPLSEEAPGRADRSGIAAMKVRVVESICQGHGMCHLACPEIFVLSDIDGHALVINENIPPNMLAVVEKAVESCPEQAIRITAD